MIIIAGPLAAETQQHRWVGDVPIMNGLIIEPELGFAFDSPNGRIVMIFGSSDTTPSEIIQFYGKDRKSTRLNSSHSQQSRMPSSA